MKSFLRGTLVRVRLDPIIGHEQAGVRPAVVVSDPKVIHQSRFPLVAVVLVTRTKVEGPWSVPLFAGQGGLKADSFALIDQLRCIDIRRILRHTQPFQTTLCIP